MQLRRGHIYAIRTCLPEFVNACISSESSSFPRGQLVNTTIRPCVLVSWTPTSTGPICQIALLATYGNSTQDQITSEALRHFSVPISYLSPRHGLAAVDVNRARPEHQYVVVCIGSVRASELCEWVDSACQSNADTLDEGAVRRLEACAIERLQTWEQIQSQDHCTNLQPQFQTWPVQPGSSHRTVGQQNPTTGDTKRTFRSPW